MVEVLDSGCLRGGTTAPTSGIRDPLPVVSPDAEGAHVGTEYIIGDGASSSVNGSPASSPWLTVLIPAFNEEEQIERSVGKVLARLDHLGVQAEILIIDDASRDRTGEIADGLALRDPRIRVVHHAAKLNIGGGFTTGVRQARGEWMILIPADLAVDLADLEKYFREADSADLVVGVCPERGDYSRLRKVISGLNVQAIRTLFRMKQRQFNHISMYRMSYLRRMTIRYWRSAFFFAEVIINAKTLGARIAEVETTYKARETGQATGANFKLVVRTAQDLVRFWPRWLVSRVTGGIGAREMSPHGRNPD
jgi:glycosyltransferase involved in cell wall biosynthesis